MFPPHRWKCTRERAPISHDTPTDALGKVASARHKEMLDYNLKAIELGYHYAD